MGPVFIALKNKKQESTYTSGVSWPYANNKKDKREIKENPDR